MSELPEWKPDLSPYTGPRYLALANAIEAGMRDGTLPPETRLPTHRALADHLDCTVGTITRGYAEAERRGLVYGVVGRGTFVRGKPDAMHTLQLAEPDDGIIDLGLNIPTPANRSADLSELLQALSRQPATLEALMLYQPDNGAPGQRETLAAWASREGWNPDPANLVVTLGAQHGILITLMAMTRPGDVILAEHLTYPGLTAVANQLGLDISALEMDDEGIIPEALDAACRARHPKALYCIPTLQNPTTAVMSLARRNEIARLCKLHDVVIIEDDVNGMLCDNAPLPFAAIAPAQTLYIGSLSKVVAPGLRTGFVIAPETCLGRLRNAIRTSCWMVSPLQAELACEWIRSGQAARQCQWQREQMAARISLTNKVLDGLSYRVSQSGFHVWLHLPEPWRAGQFEREALQRGVIVKGAGIFAVGRQPAPHSVRLALSSAHSLTELQRGLEIIREMALNGPEHQLALV